ncbi:MAG: YbgF trimerization domain-containing protein, partial [Gammaproteobacteria bacterium]
MVLLFALALLTAPGVMAAQSANERLDIIERKLESRGLVDMLNRLEQLQQSLQEMRGEMEVQANTLQQIQRQQRQQYLDIDRRLRQLESAPAAGTAAAIAPSAGPRVGAPAVTAPPVIAVPP